MLLTTVNNAQLAVMSFPTENNHFGENILTTFLHITIVSPSNSLSLALSLSLSPSLSLPFSFILDRERFMKRL